MEAMKAAKLGMFHSITDLCDSNATTVALVAAFDTAYTVFKTTITGITTASAQVEAQTGGAAISKKNAKKSMAQLGAGIAGMVYAYASVTDDDELKEAVRVSYTDISQAKDDEAISICSNIYDAANTNIANLGDYGVTAALLTTFQTATNGFAGKATKPRQTVSEKKAMREQINAMFDDAEKVLKERMDKLAVNFKTNGHADFEAQYRAARVIVNPGSFSTVLKLQALNKANNEPLLGAKVYRDASTAFKKSTAKGFVTFKDIEEGNHSFTVKHKLFDDAQLSGVVIAHGDKKTVNVQMTATAQNSSSDTVVREGDLGAGVATNINTDNINGTDKTNVTFEISGSTMRFYATSVIGSLPGAVYVDMPVGTTTKPASDFTAQIGLNDMTKYLMVQNLGPLQGHYKLTFDNLE